MKYLILSMNPGYDRWHIVNKPPKLTRVCRADRALSIVSGKGLNVARVLHHLAFEDYALISIEAGRTGMLINAACIDEGIRVISYPVMDEARINVTIIKEYEKDTMTYNEPGPSLSSDEVAGYVRAVGRILAENAGATLIVSGSAPDGFDTAAFGEILDNARKTGHAIMADIGGKWLPETVKGALALLKINREEFVLEFGFDGYRDPARLKTFMREKRMDSIVLTDGERGAMAADGDELIRCSLEENCGGHWAVGSGDAFFAGWLSALAEGKSLHERMILANACGIANTFVYGPCTLETGEVERCRQFVNITESGKL